MNNRFIPSNCVVLNTPNQRWVKFIREIFFIELGPDISTILFFKYGPFMASFSFIFVFSLQLTVKNVQYKFCRWLDSNHGPLELEVTALPTEPHHCPFFQELGSLSLRFLLIHCQIQTQYLIVHVRCNHWGPNCCNWII